MKEILKNLKIALIIFITVVIISIPLFLENLNVYYDDGIQHLIRGFLTSNALKNGESTKVLSTLSNGFGYSWDLFYGPFSSIMIALFNFFTNNIINAYKIVLFLGLLLSGITMYFFVKKITDDKNVGALAGVLYMAMPYHLTDMYIRNALGEFLSYIFIPLVFLGLYNLFNKQKREWLLVIGAVGLIITHNLMTVITAIFAILYVCVNLPKLKDKRIREKFLFCSIFIICISSFYWVPLLQTSITTNYEVYQSGKMATSETVASHGLELKQLIITTNDSGYPFELGAPLLIMLCFTVAVFRRIIPKMKKDYIFFLVVGIISTFMATKYFPWKLLGEKVAIIQFPWRMMLISNFCFAVIGSMNMGIVIRNFKFKDVIVLGIIIIVYTISLKSLFIITDANIVQVEDYENIGFVSGNNSDVLDGMGKSEYLPKNAYDNSFYVATREAGVLVLEGSANIENEKKDGNTLTFSVEITEDATVLELPYIYYPGYKITLDGVALNYYENENGFITISLNEIAKSDIKVEYTGTQLMQYSNIFSLVSVVLFVAYIIFIGDDKKVSFAKVEEKP